MIDSLKRNYITCVSKDLVLLLNQASHSFLLSSTIVIQLVTCATVGYKTKAFFSKKIFAPYEPFRSPFNGKKACASKMFLLYRERGATIFRLVINYWICFLYSQPIREPRLHLLLLLTIN